MRWSCRCTRAGCATTIGRSFPVSGGTRAPPSRREQATETAGFYNTVGFNDDTRAFLSIPARHDVARRIDCRFLAQLVAEHKIEEDEAFELAPELAYRL